ncbi:MAG: ATP-binding protein [Maritimibacter sp.]
MLKGIIQTIEISGLFGRFEHVVPRDGVLHSPAILYGDNGVGKSTILNMVFHLLSAAGNEGHRTALRKIPFKKISVSLVNGARLTAEKGDDFDTDSVLTLQVWKEGGVVAEWEQTGRGRNYRYAFDDEILREIKLRGGDFENISSDLLMDIMTRRPSTRHHDQVKRGEKGYLDALRTFAPAMFYLNADRKLDSDSVADPSEELELRQALNHRELKHATDVLQASRAISLKQALSNASRWVNSRAVRSANLGSENVHSVYEKVIGQLAIDYQPKDSALFRAEIDELISDLNKIEGDTRDFAEYELTSKLSMEKFRWSLNTGDPSRDSMSARLIGPYVKSLTSRLDAIRPIYEVLDDFVTTINGFLTRKTLTYELSHGFVILDDRNDKLEASQLSSGEQQLLLIFSYVLAARDTPSVFIIDEPEISLNVKWQRKMVESLMRVSEGSEIQFILASHSIELITQHMDSVVEIY